MVSESRRLVDTFRSETSRKLPEGADQSVGASSSGAVPTASSDASGANKSCARPCILLAAAVFNREVLFKCIVD